MSFTLGELATRFGLIPDGDTEILVKGVNTLKHAHAGDLAFLANGKYRRELADCRASVVVLSSSDRGLFAGAALISSNPYAAYARIAQLFAPRFDESSNPRIHPSAVIDPSARISKSARIGPLSVVEALAEIGDGVRIGPHCLVGRGARIGPESQLIARVSVLDRVEIGARVILHPGAVIGSDGFGLAPDRGAWVKVPQLGSVRIGDDCEIGANSTIDRGALEDTVLAADVRIDNQVQIAHNVSIGAHTAMAGCSAVAGSARIGANCLIGGGAGILGHLSVCDGVTITAMSLVTHDIREPGEYSSGTPLDRNLQWRKNAVRFTQLDDLARRVKSLTKDSS